MAHQEEGWPLGLLSLNARTNRQLVRNHELSSELVSSFSTLRTAVSPSTSPSSSSSDLDTQSTGSFYQDRSVSLGRLMGYLPILQLPRISTTEEGVGGSTRVKSKKNMNRSMNWLYSHCLKPSNADDHTRRKARHSLGFFLEEERRATSIRNRRHRSDRCL